jgi:hypothetical protein
MPKENRPADFRRAIFLKHSWPPVAAATVHENDALQR